MKRFLSRSIWPLLLLPVFFVAHGYAEFYPIIQLGDAATLCAIYMGIGLILSGCLRLLYKDWEHSQLMAMALLGLEFFFGAAQDSIRSLLPNSGLSRYTFLLPLMSIIAIALGILIKRIHFNTQRFTRFLTVALITLIVWDIIQLTITKKAETPQVDSLILSTNGQKTLDSEPDIYLIIADTYPGATTLLNYFNRSNDTFYTALKARGFYVADSARSNYNFTEFSTASLLQMDYLRKIEGRQASLNHLGYCFEVMKKSPFIKFLQGREYDFNNFSQFDFYGHPSPVIPTLLPGRTKPITEQTFSARVRKDIGYHFFTDIPFMAEWFGLEWAEFRNNRTIIQSTLTSLKKETNDPTFTYTHLMMPHVPFYYDRNGIQLKKPIHDAKDTSAFLGYLEHTNNQLISLIDSILLKPKRPTAILLIGDHGHRDYLQNVSNEEHFKTLVSVLLPERNYQEFYPTMSHVNLLRATVNSLFGAQLPYLKDSTVFLKE